MPAGSDMELLTYSFVVYRASNMAAVMLHSNDEHQEVDCCIYCCTIDLMHKSWSGPCVPGHRNLRVVVGYSLREE